MNKLQFFLIAGYLLIKLILKELESSGFITDSNYISIILEWIYSNIDYFLIHCKSFYIMLRAKK